MAPLAEQEVPSCRSEACSGSLRLAGFRRSIYLKATTFFLRCLFIITYGFNISVLGVLAVGASAFLMERYSSTECLAMLRAQPFTLFPGVPTMFQYLLQRAGTDPPRLPTLRCCISAGAIMPASLNRNFEQRFLIPVLDGYGITETSTMVTMNWIRGTRIMGSCGLPIPGLSVRIVDPIHGDDKDPGEDGELIVRGPKVMHGYYKRPSETAAALKDGWYHSGDLARYDRNGFITITGRLKELIIRGAQNIAPAEVEEVLASYPGVLDCAVIGLPHAQLGEVPIACIVEIPERRVEASALLSYCRRYLSAYKVPESVHIVDEIPRTGSGKIQRFLLSQRLQSTEQT
jgi:long-chain acyl-CoA synthetase